MRLTGGERYVLVLVCVHTMSRHVYVCVCICLHVHSCIYCMHCVSVCEQDTATRT